MESPNGYFANPVQYLATVGRDGKAVFENNMEVKMNKEIRDYQESMFWGLSFRQCLFSVLAILAALGIYFLTRKYAGEQVTGWLCVLGAAPFAARMPPRDDPAEGVLTLPVLELLFVAVIGGEQGEFAVGMCIPCAQR